MTINGQKIDNAKLLLSPILKWVGGKRQLLSTIMPLIPKRFSTFFEPFLGGGAVLFKLRPIRAIINDSNDELINVYNCVKNNPEELIRQLEIHNYNNSEEYYYNVRSWDRDESYNALSLVDKAARIIYLNKTCYNGLFRVNQAGQFNSPYGKYKKPNIVNKPAILAMNKYFTANDIQIINKDYKVALESIQQNDFVYFDPPYLPISDSSSFTGYTDGGFTIENQIELRDKCLELDQHGVKFLLSNSDHPMIRDLYHDFSIISVKARRSINSIAHKRGEIDEVLIKNYG